MGSHFEQANRMSFWIGLENLPNSHCVSSFDWRGDPIVGRRLCKLSEKSALTPGIAHWSLSFRWMATNSRTFFPRSISTPALVLFHLTRQGQKVEQNVSPLLLMSVKSHVCPKPNTHLFIYFAKGNKSAMSLILLHFSQSWPHMVPNVSEISSSDGRNCSLVVVVGWD